jgi:type VI secretion system secreted protein Hcp
MAQRFFVTIEGEKTGAFKGESLLQRHQGQVEGLGFQYGLSLSYDLETGQASGKRQHGSVTMTKAWGAASPQLFQALVNNELLKVVTFEFYRVDRSGVEALFQKVTLDQATVRKHQPARRANLRPRDGELPGARGDRLRVPENHDRERSRRHEGNG